MTDSEFLQLMNNDFRLERNFPIADDVGGFITNFEVIDTFKGRLNPPRSKGNEQILASKYNVDLTYKLYVAYGLDVRTDDLVYGVGKKLRVINSGEPSYNHHHLEINLEELIYNEILLKAIIAANSSLYGLLSVLNNMIGNIIESSEVSGILGFKLSFKGLIEEDTSLGGILGKTIVISGEVVEDGNLIGLLKIEAEFRGEIFDISDIIGDLEIAGEKTLQGNILGITIISGDMIAESIMNGFIDEISILSGKLIVGEEIELIGDVIEVVGLSGDIKVNVSLEGEMLGVSELIGNVEIDGLFEGEIEESTSLNGNIEIGGEIVLNGEIVEIGVLVGEIIVEADFKGLVEASTSLDGDIKVDVFLEGSILEITELIGNVEIDVPLEGEILEIGILVGDIEIDGLFEGLVEENSILDGDLEISGEIVLSGDILEVGILVGDIVIEAEFKGLVEVSTSLDGKLEIGVEVILNGNILEITELDGNIKVDVEVKGEIIEVTEISGDIKINVPLEGEISEVGVLVGEIIVEADFKGLVEASTSLDGDLEIGGEIILSGEIIEIAELNGDIKVNVEVKGTVDENTSLDGDLEVSEEIELIGNVIEIAELNGDIEIETGEILLSGVIAESGFLNAELRVTIYTNFSEYATDVQPSDWTKRWNVSGSSYLVKNESGTIGGKILSMYNAGNLAMSGFSWDELDGKYHLEILTKIRTDRIMSWDKQNIVMLRGSGISSTYGYVFMINQPGYSTKYFSFRRWDGTSVTILQESQISVEVDTWYWIKIYMKNNQFKGKIWTDGSSEPGAWRIEVEDSTYLTGWNGIGTNTYYTHLDTDVFSALVINYQESLSGGITDSSDVVGSVESNVFFKGLVEENSNLDGNIKKYVLINGEIIEIVGLSGDIKVDVEVKGTIEEDSILDGILKIGGEIVLNGEISEVGVLVGGIKVEAEFKGEIEEDSSLDGILEVGGEVILVGEILEVAELNGLIKGKGLFIGLIEESGFLNAELRITIYKRFTDFSEYITGVVPYDWENIWNGSDNDWEVIEVEGAIGGKKLKVNSTVSNEEKMLVWNKVGSFKNLEVLAKLKPYNMSNVQSYIGVRAKIENDKLNGLLVGICNNSEIKIYGYNNNIEKVIFGCGFSYDFSKSVWIRFYIYDDFLKVKMWIDGTAEPSSGICVKHSFITTLGIGSVGLGRFLNSEGVFDYFEVTNLDTLKLIEGKVEENSFSSGSLEILKLIRGAVEENSSLNGSLEALKLIKGKVEENNSLNGNLEIFIYTDFSEYTTGVQPSDWTKRYSTIGTIYEVKEKSGTIGGKVLEMKDVSGMSNSGFTWNKLDSIVNMEVLIRCRTTGEWQNASQNTIIVRGSGGTFTPTIYVTMITNVDNVKKFQIKKFVEGVGIVLATIDYDWNTNIWYWMKFYINGNQLKSKLWIDGNAEPGWILEVSDSDITSGYNGLGSYEVNEFMDIDVFKIIKL